MRPIKDWKEKLLYLGIYAAVILGARALDLPCVFRYFLHFPCPGCGMTRAMFCLLELDIAGAFSYHWMFWSIPILLLYYFYDGTLLPQKWLNRGLLIAIGIGFLANWIFTIFWR